MAIPGPVRAYGRRGPGGPERHQRGDRSQVVRAEAGLGHLDLDDGWWGLGDLSAAVRGDAGRSRGLAGGLAGDGDSGVSDRHDPRHLSAAAAGGSLAVTGWRPRG